MQSAKEERVMPDADLTQLCGVETRVLVLAVKRKLARFHEDFMFQLSQRPGVRQLEVTNCDLKCRARRRMRSLSKGGDLVYGAGRPARHRRERARSKA